MNETIIASAEVPETILEDGASADEKSYTLRSAKSELRKLENARENRKQAIKRLQAELRDLNQRIKQMTALVDDLAQEELHRKILMTFNKKMTPEQVSKALDLIQKVNGDLDAISVDQIAEIVHSAAEDAREKEMSEPAGTPT